MDSRINRLFEDIKDDQSAFLITSQVNRFYLTGFNCTDGAVFVTKSAAYCLVDFRYGEAARAAVKDCKVIVYTKYSNSIKELCQKHNVKNVYIENENISLADAKRTEKTLNQICVNTVTDKVLDILLCNMRIIKSSAEIEKIRQAQKITEAAYAEILNYIKPGVKECDIALELEYLIRKKGAQDVSFDLITITGQKTSMPHGVPDKTIVKDGDFFTMDIGAVYDGYRSDMTRTVAIGSVTERQREIYSIVLNAQLTALSAIQAGVKCSEVDAAARQVISKAGYGEYFGHAAGHGVGLDIHENPRLSPRDDTILSAGMVVTDEPGIYLPGEFGVRIEDTVAVTKDGCDNLVTVEKNLIIL